MNKQWLLAFARGKGYKGKAELADIKTWLKDELGYDPDKLSIGGKEHKVDDIWAKSAAIDCPEPAPEPEPTPASDPEPTPKRKAAQTGAGFKKGPGGVDAAPPSGGMTPKMHRRLNEKAYYNRKAKAGKVCFNDADTAERAGAYFRLCVTDNLPGAENYTQKALDKEIIGKDMAEGVNTTGGAMVPEEFDPTMIWLTENYGSFRKICRIQRMSRDQLNAPRRTSLLAMSALGEGASMTATNNAYDNVGLTAKKWGVLVKSSTELIEDSAINIADEITSSVAEAQAFSEDQAAAIGDGTSTYNGIQGLVQALPTGAYIAQATSNTWLTQVEADILGLVGSVTNVTLKNCAFYCSRQYFWTVPMRLAQAKGGNNAMSTFIYGGEGGDRGEDAMLYGFPVYFNELLPIVTATTARSLYFGDFKKAAVLGDRRDLRIDFSDQRYFDSDQIAWRATSRFTINIHGDGRGSTVGPIACLKCS